MGSPPPRTEICYRVCCPTYRDRRGRRTIQEREIASVKDLRAATGLAVTAETEFQDRSCSDILCP
jgi:hypothetical protein